MKKIILSTLLVISAGSLSAEGSHKGGHGMAHWMAPPEAASKPNPIKSDPASIDRGKQTYFKNCASCHGEKAMGNGPAAAALNPKPANLAMMAGMHPDGDFAWKIANGRGAMPAWKNALKETQIWELVNYIKSLKLKGKAAMNMGDMKAMEKMMPNMDHSNMSMEDMQKMMSNMGHSDADGHHDAPKTNVELHHDDGEKSHSH